MKKINLACIIEDDPIHLMLTKKYMELSGMVDNIMVCKDGFEAYNMLSAIIQSGKNLPELILLDLNMPNWDGWKFLDEFIKIPVEQKITIYILTGSSKKEDLLMAKKYDLHGNYLIKPTDLRNLKEMLNNLKA
ncbi:response regulator [Belliella aquatica]|uniref:Response regulator n=1 Tax=Belliella aquatica TaxID=1323734 RepID=A0ABQ1LMG9_9BACT|nr:response regulator [Belliella aquatica]MCH7404313.1 response regulator [Belliella aquatica]GGC27013.1 response regulator [Belliella aquatica]